RIGVPAIMAVAAVPVLMLGETPWVGYGLAIGTLLVSWAANRPVALGTDVAVRVLLVATAVGYAVATTTGRTTGAGGGPGWLMAGGVLLLVVLLAEPAVRRLARPWYHAANLPGARPGRAAAMVVDGTAWLAKRAAGARVVLAAGPGGGGWAGALAA